MKLHINETPQAMFKMTTSNNIDWYTIDLNELINHCTMYLQEYDTGAYIQDAYIEMNILYMPFDIEDEEYGKSEEYVKKMIKQAVKDFIRDYFIKTILTTKNYNVVQLGNNSDVRYVMTEISDNHTISIFNNRRSAIDYVKYMEQMLSK